MTDAFFDESEEQSRVKAQIVSKYFWAWAKVVIPSARSHEGHIAYLDLFAGPGRYKDGTPSTPILVLEKAIADREIRTMLVSVFNDRNKANAALLGGAIESLPEVAELKYKPQILTEAVGTELAEKLQRVKLVPTLLFVDPWGYKGLSLALISSVLKDWGSDCIFFFNYNRINPGLNNPVVLEHMNGLFGKERVNRIRKRLEGLRPEKREALIIEEISEALQEVGGYVIHFRFQNDVGTRTSHYLMFVSKNFRGYEIMKDIMAGESSDHEQGVASFEYSGFRKTPSLFPSKPLEDLEEALLRDFAGRRSSMKEIYETHSVGKRYVKANYKKALTNLEVGGKVTAAPPADKRPKRQGDVTFADDVIVAFPRRGEG